LACSRASRCRSTYPTPLPLPVPVPVPVPLTLPLTLPLYPPYPYSPNLHPPPQVDSSFAIVKDAYPYIAQRLLTDPSPELQSALTKLIFGQDGKLRWGYLEALVENAADSSAYQI